MAHVRTLVQHGSKIFWALMAVALAFTLTSNAAVANHQPANKIAASAGVSEVDFIAEGQTEELLSTTLKTSKPSELLLNVSAECSIITQVATTENDAAQTAHGQLKFFLEIATEGGGTRRIGVQEASGPANTGAAADNGEVVFCDRTHTQTLTDSADSDGRLTTYLNTRAANAFNWLALNVGSGVHTITLSARFSDAGTSTDQLAEGAVGRRTLIIEPVRAANDASHVEQLSTP